MIYNEHGDLVGKQAFKTGDLISKEVTKLYKTLFKQGMTIIEGRALTTHLVNAVEVAALIALIKAQLDETTPLHQLSS